MTQSDNVFHPHRIVIPYVVNRPGGRPNEERRPLFPVHHDINPVQDKKSEGVIYHFQGGVMVTVMSQRLPFKIISHSLPLTTCKKTKTFSIRSDNE